MCTHTMCVVRACAACVGVIVHDHGMVFARAPGQWVTTLRIAVYDSLIRHVSKTCFSHAAADCVCSTRCSPIPTVVICAQRARAQFTQ
jgi:hypothetical protein